ncbi:hypothetical protein BDY17DRAFT_308599 [Neohortaea acidophila]|uniref:Uncharacterized protein n=1 Tax=Neohortaea acidophila TaxID=245834 RepID=A0A6A6PYS9_9PEZI|nr:uncharacterized protein BDY17DRAFT_308599 [Neohortaea acidophila]KAF2485152.1 hypothetical protein BDY17DRAFT_308599 [Neohortaea acidophila]
MLPPQLRQGAVVSRAIPTITLALKVSTPSLLHTRGFWSWRRHDWSSHLDPAYHRYNRVRTIKTRAKLLKSLRRRGKFDWDVDYQPFFTPRLVRCASHWDGSGKRRTWSLDGEEEKRKTKDISVEEKGFELSQREKEWRDKLAAMRKRLDKDPYEAIFGKRFEPFWGPLVPSWMREEMGLQGWPKKEVPKATADQAEAVKIVKNETADKAKPKEPKTAAGPTTSAPPAPTEKTPANSYSYASSTSWDSWTNKTKRVEWDSVSRQTRRYEYDPISNRMVQVEAPKSEALKSVELPTSHSNAVPVQKDEGNVKTTKSEPTKIPVQQSSEVRKSIPIPPPQFHPYPGSPVAFGRSTVTSLGPLKSTALAPGVAKPSALAKLPEKEPSKDKDVDNLTADDVRASMRKTKQQPSPATGLEGRAADLETISNGLKSKLSGMHVEKNPPSQWDQAEMGVMLDKELETLKKKKEKLARDEKGLFHIERQKKELMKLDERIKEVTARVEKLGVEIDAEQTKPAAASTVKAVGLQSSLDRMQSKDLPQALDLDDSAAHESTESFGAFKGVPRGWEQQAELLQADRVRRTASKRPYPSTPPMRWAEDMQARKTAYEAQEALVEQESEEVSAAADRRAKLEKANKILEAEVAEQKLKMQQYETRYSHKLRTLKEELDIAYKQSTVHAEKHLERVRFLEQELGKAQKAVGDTPSVASESKVAKLMDEAKQKRKQKELERAEQKAKDQRLVKEVKEIYEKAYGRIDDKHRQPLIEQKKPALCAPAPEKKQRQVVEVESDVDLGEALARYEKEAPYNGPKSSVENEIALKEKEFYEAQRTPFDMGIKESSNAKIVNDSLPKLIPTELSNSGTAPIPEEPTTPTSSTNTRTIQWQQPPLYKVLAYDSGNDIMTTADTTSTFTTSESPISIPQALSQLYQPARFVPYFADLQKSGYQVIFGTKDLLVFRKVQAEAEAAAAGAVAPEASSIGMEDHGLFNSTDQPTPTSATSQVTPNPAVDDGIFEDPDLEWRHYPRVRRIEQHFTGARRRWNTGNPYQKRLQQLQQRAEERAKGERAGRKRGERSSVRWILGVGAGAATVMYVVGAAAEKARESADRDEWVRRAAEMERRKGN